MGGEIRVDSALGEGSCFWFELSVPTLDEASDARTRPRAAITGYEGPRRSVLIVDDVAGNRAMLSDLLGTVGFEVREASGGQEALECLRQALPDLILMDIAMPVMDGLEATRRIRANPAWSRVPIIAVSAMVSSLDQSRSPVAGVNAFLNKPIDVDHLLHTIGANLNLRWDSKAGDAAADIEAQGVAGLVVPPPQDLQTLYRVARTGNMRAVRDQAAQLRSLDPSYVPLADKLDRLAQGFESRAILALATRYIEEADGADSAA
jgi:CheY-like chemotaxis protein